MPTNLIILIIVIVVAIWLWAGYNGLVKARNRTKEAWSDIDVQLKRRFDLIPTLVETVKGYATHEKEVFEKVTEARSKILSSQTLQERAESENILGNALKSLFAVAEAYPELRASENFKHLQEELTDTEDKIQAARRFYNMSVLELNNRVQQFPTNILASWFGFQESEFFELQEEEAREKVEVKF